VNRATDRLQNGITRIAFLGGTVIFGAALLDDFLSPFIPLIVTVLGSLIAGTIVKAIFVKLLNRRLFSQYRYTSTNTKNNNTKSRTTNKRNDTEPNEQINNQETERENPFAPPDPLSIYRNLLGLGARFTSEELKTAYRSAAAMYHPDRYASSSRDERQSAEDLMKKVNEAYEKLKQAAL
jgi:uncharacterized protein (DUF697 family)